MEEVVGFTQKQREWFLARDGHQCQFYRFNGLKWVRCRNTNHLQVHHIVPRGWARTHLPHNFQLNGSMNGITLCEEHHVGKFGVHPDTFIARVEYNTGNEDAYKEMMAERRTKNQQGEPYWNTKWDWQFNRICRKATLKFIRSNRILQMEIEVTPVGYNKVTPMYCYKGVFFIVLNYQLFSFLNCRFLFGFGLSTHST